MTESMPDSLAVPTLLAGRQQFIKRSNADIKAEISTTRAFRTFSPGRGVMASHRYQVVFLFVEHHMRKSHPE